VGNRIRLVTEVAKSTKEFASLRPTGNTHITNTPEQENESPAPPQITEELPAVAYAQATGNSIETPTITTNNTHEHALIN
jgi:hypothetical protein